MFPLRDENPSQRFPLVTRGLIALNCALFVYEVLLGPELRPFLFQHGLVPARFTHALLEGGWPGFAGLSPFLTSMFLHAGWMHLIGNMWYLWIFGDNVEDRLGSVGFLAFYLGAGLFAAFAHYVLDAASPLPTVGASGAIAGVLGAYVMLFPRARIVTLVPLFPFWQVLALPAVLVLGLWFVLQFFQGALSLGVAHTGGVAWWAHIGGFLFGLALMRLGRRRRALRGEW
jgi:membrane associated rhomboid family serine protease